MTNFEILLLFLLAVMLAAYWASRYESSNKIEEMRFEVRRLRSLARTGAMDSLLNVNKFNEWFNSPKDKSIYAHPGIFLRTDKLSKGHFDDYIKMKTLGALCYKDFDEMKMIQFEDKVRKDWMKKLMK